MRYLSFLWLFVLGAPVVAASDNDDRFLFEGEKVVITFMGPTPSRVPYSAKTIIAKLGASFERAGAKFAPARSVAPGMISYPEATVRSVKPTGAISRREPTAEVAVEIAIDIPPATGQSFGVRDARNRISGSSRRQNVIVSFTINFWRISDDGRATVKMMSLDVPFSEEVQSRVVVPQLSIERDEAASIFYQHAFDAGLKELEAKLRPMFERRLMVIGIVLPSERADLKDPVFVIQLRPGVITILDGATIELWEPGLGSAPLRPKFQLKIRNPKHGGGDLGILCCEIGSVEFLEKFKAGDIVVTTSPKLREETPRVRK